MTNATDCRHYRVFKVHKQKRGVYIRQHSFSPPRTGCWNVVPSLKPMLLQLLKNEVTFYRATLCVGAVFVVALRPSVCLSVTLVQCIHTVEDIVKLLRRPDSPWFWYFWLIAPVPNFKWNPFSGCAKYTGWKIFAIFDWNHRLSRKRYEIGPWLLWNINRKSYALYRMVTFTMTLTDL